MLHKDLQQHEGQRQVRKARGSKRRTLDSVFEKNGAYDGRLFHSRDKMTYTYLCDGEVMVLHFDSLRRELFFKGHHITDLQQTEDLRSHLAKFRGAVLQDQRAHAFLPAFDSVIAALCSQAGIASL